VAPFFMGNYMNKYRAKTGFEDDRLGSVSRGQRFALAPAAAQKYINAGLLEQVGAPALDPITPAGTPLPVSPAGQALPLKTAQRSKRGRKKTPGGVSS
jgi:hypothetical protein